jgi:hypothetical protein
MSLKEAVTKIEEDLAWRGPNGSPLRYVVIPREMAQELLAPLSETYQRRLVTWLFATFDESHVRDVRMRAHRFLEEALELYQAVGCLQQEASAIAHYVFHRPVGEVRQEVGGTMTGLGALCFALGLDVDEERERELKRCWEKIDTIRKKQASKPSFDRSPLPGKA